MYRGYPVVLNTVGAVVLLISLIGCDDRTPPPAVVAEAPPEPVVPSRPTTQQLEMGERATLGLAGVPFQIRAPAGWQVKVVGNDNVLTGPTPFGTVQIVLTQRPMMRGTHVDPMIAAAEKAAADDQTHRSCAKLMQQGGVKLLDRCAPLLNTATTITTAPAGDIANDAAGDTASGAAGAAAFSPTIMWKITAFVPRGSEYDVFEMNFQDLHEDQYKIDKQFLERIVESLKYDPSALVGG